LDLMNNDLIVDTATLADVTDAVRSGSNGSFWTGTGLTSGTAAGKGGVTALGVIQNIANPIAGTGGPMYTSFDGISTRVSGAAFDGSEILVKYTYFGDFNLDGLITSIDFALLDAGFAGTTQLDGKPGWFFGDANYNGTVDSTDYALMQFAYNNFSNTGTYNFTALPEPGSLLLAAVGLIGLGLQVASRRRKPGVA